MASLADLLDYDQRKKQLLQSAVDQYSKGYGVANAFTEGLADQAKGMGQMVMHPIDTAKQLYEGGKAAIQNPQAALQAAKEGLTEAVNSPENIARFAGQNFNPMDIANALNKVGKMRELTVYHGTPHTLPPTKNNPLGEFDASKIGTGEGAAAYGHGIYVAQSPGVAKSYAINLGGKEANLINNAIDRTIHIHGGDTSAIKDALILEGFPKEKITPEIEKSIKKIVENTDASGSPNTAAIREYNVLKKMVPETGNFYTVDLPDEHIERMLDWDKTLSEQHPDVQAALKGIEQELPTISGFNLKSWMDADPLASTWHNVINRDLQLEQPEIAKILTKRGITGIKYLDEGSRSKAYQVKLSVKGKPYETDPITFATKEQANKAAKEYAAKGFTADVKDAGTRNFVVFPGEEQNLKILKRK